MLSQPAILTPIQPRLAQPGQRRRQRPALRHSAGGKGPPAKIIRRWEADEFGVVTSPPLISELERAPGYPQVRKYLKLSQHEMEGFLRRFTTVAGIVTPQATLDVIKKDPADKRVLECALAGGAAYLVSGDEHLLDLKAYKGVVILNPRGFLAVLDLAQRENA